MVLDDLAGAINDLAERFGLNTAPDPSITIDRLVDERTRARAEKDWARSDEIRDGLLGIGIRVEDASGGTRWHRQ